MYDESVIGRAGVEDMRTGEVGFNEIDGRILVLLDRLSTVVIFTVRENEERAKHNVDMKNSLRD